MSTLDGATSLEADCNGQILSASVTLLALPTVFVALRLVSRLISGAGLWVSFLVFQYLGFI